MKVSKKIFLGNSMQAKEGRESYKKPEGAIKLHGITAEERQKLRIPAYHYLLP